MSSPSTAPSPDWIGWQLLAFLGVFIPLQAAVVGLRLYVRRNLSRGSFGWDDYLCICALVCQMINAAIAIGSVDQAGIGHHADWLQANDPEALDYWVRYLVAMATWYFFSVNVPKLAILALYLRLFPQRNVRIIIWILVVILCCASISITIASLAACIPFEANFNTANYTPNLPGARCINKAALYVWASMPNIVTDIVMLVLPMPIVFKLNLNIKIKIGLVLAFAVGSLGLVSSVLRFETFYTIYNLPSLKTDRTWDSVELIIWTNAEPGIYLICACLPVYKTLVDRWNHRKTISHPSGASDSTYSAYKGPKRSNPTQDDDSQTELRPIGVESIPVELENLPAEGIQVSTSITAEWSSNPASQVHRTAV